jgi:hypothetical protein
MHTENITIVNAEDIKQLTGQHLVRFFNQLTGGDIKKFSDRETGLKRTQEAFVAKGESVDYEMSLSSDTDKPDATDSNMKTVNTKNTGGRKGKKTAKANPSSNGERARKTFDLPAKAKIKEHREGTARAKAVDVLKKGATFEALQKATGWKNHRHAYEGIRLLNTHLGYGVKEANGVIKIFTK